MLTVLVPIHGDEDFIRRTTQVPTIGNTVENLVYLYNGVYYRRFGDTITEVVDVEFPRIGHPLELFDFNYSATRMGTAPTITASTKWYAEEDENDHLFYNLDNKWTQECHVVYDNQNYYLNDIPTSSKDNEDARYKYDIVFVSHWRCIETVYIYDVVAPYIAERPLNENSTFSFFGDITELRKRINASLVRSGLSTYSLRQGVTSYFTYKQWNNIPMGSQSDPDGYYQLYQGNYTAYLQNEVFVYENGEFAIDGYQVIIDDGVVSDEKMISFDKNFIFDALQKICDKDEGFGLTYYYKHGTKEIHIGDSEYDFGEDNAVSYGRYRELLSIKKTNNTERVINRMTGVGSSENIPYYYPNPTADGWLKSVYNRPTNRPNIPSISDAEETDIFPSAAANAYEKFLKNRLGYTFEYGRVLKSISAMDYNKSQSRHNNQNIVLLYNFNTYDHIRATRENIRVGVDNLENADVFVSGGVRSPFLNLSINIGLRDDTTARIKPYTVSLVDFTAGVTVEYSSTATYSTMNGFQEMLYYNDGKHPYALSASHNYLLVLNVTIGTMPLMTDYDYQGYFYPAIIQGASVANPDHFNIFEGEFYDRHDLLDAGSSISGSSYMGYVSRQANASVYLNSTEKYPYYIFTRCQKNDTIENTLASTQTPLKRVKGAIYKDLSDGTMYRCTSDEIFVGRNYGFVTYEYMVSSILNEVSNFEANPVMQIKDWVMKFLDIDCHILSADGWYLDGKKVNLSDYGMTLNGTPYMLDNITFERLKYLIPQGQLMPELFYKTDGERRFYNAVNYPFEGSIADAESGEYIDGADVENDLYKDEGGNYRVFESPYVPIKVSEFIGQFDDIKPSIKGMTNTIEGRTFRIDVAAEYAYDELDDDSIWENESDGNIEGDYKHPHFFIKLRQLPFNIFDLALTEDMEISLTSGQCGSCKFKIKVDERTKKNPVQVWEYDIYKKKEISSATDYDPYVKVASEGDLKRYTNKILYRRGDRHIIDIGQRSVVYYDYIVVDTDFGSMYNANAIQRGIVGTLNTENYNHIEGDVVTRGAFQDIQQDTSSGEVWLALEKDTDTFGMLMPAARPTYGDSTFSIYYRPKSVADTGDEDTADTFVLTNIKMPQYYLRFAERELSKAIIGSMCKQNAQTFNFSMNYSRIFLAENKTDLANLTENAVLYIDYNHKKYKQYIQEYVYKMVSTEPLPEISVRLNDELSVVYGGFANRITKNVTRTVSREVADSTVAEITRKMQKRYIGRNSTSVISGNIVSVQSDSSIAEIRIDTNTNAQSYKAVTSNLGTETSIRETDIVDVKTRDNTVRRKVNELVERANDNTLRLTSLSGAIYTYNNAKEREKDDMIMWNQCIIDGQMVPNPEDVGQCKVVKDIENMEIITD